MPHSYTRYWRIRKYLPERYQQRCRIVVYGKRLNSALVEFEDGTRYITIRHFVTAPNAPQPKPKPKPFPENRTLDF